MYQLVPQLTKPVLTGLGHCRSIKLRGHFSDIKPGTMYIADLKDSEQQWLLLSMLWIWLT